jgi:flagellar hook-length control protein FliK
VPDAVPTAAAAPQAPAGRQAPEAPVAAAPQAPGVPAETQAPTPAPAPTPAAPPAPPQATPASSTAYAVEELRAVVQLANSRGAAHARIQLRPAELGGLLIRLTSTADGMVATITAERPEAVTALDGAAAELRRTLEDRGVTLVSLDVSLAADAGDGAATGRREAPGDRAADTPERPGAADGSADATDPDDDLITAPAVRLPAGSLVDVQA